MLSILISVRKCSIELEERGIEVLEADYSTGIKDVLGTSWNDLLLREHWEPVEYLGFEGTICAKGDSPKQCFERSQQSS